MTFLLDFCANVVRFVTCPGSCAPRHNRITVLCWVTEVNNKSNLVVLAVHEVL